VKLVGLGIGLGLDGTVAGFAVVAPRYSGHEFISAFAEFLKNLPVFGLSARAVG